MRLFRIMSRWSCEGGEVKGTARRQRQRFLSGKLANLVLHFRSSLRYMGTATNTSNYVKSTGRAFTSL